MKRSIMLLSGGVDSAVNTALAFEQTELVLLLTFDYGQLSAKKEIEASKRIGGFYDIPSKILEIPWLGEITNTALCNQKRELPTFERKLPDDRKTLSEIARQVWVPNRNGLFINIAACFAENLDAELIITGFNAEEGETFPDNQPLFIALINQSLSQSTLKKCWVHSYTSNLQKKDIVKLGLEKKVPFEFIYSCYAGENKMCGKCESCMRLIRAFKANDCYEMIEGSFKDDNEI